MGRKPLSQARLLKYRLLRWLPGDLGRRYKSKHRFGDPVRGFAQALQQNGDLTMVDLGANLGVYTRRMAEHSPDVIAFEPDPWAFDELKKSVSHLDNVRLVQAAAGLSDGTLPLYRHGAFSENPKPFSQHSSMLAGKSDIDPNAVVMVEQVDFLRFLRDLDRDIGILKIDIEGAEVELLEALLEEKDLLERIRYVFAETHETRIPEHVPRVAALRDAALQLEWPAINLYWH